jgi:hypothetical protein
MRHILFFSVLLAATVACSQKKSSPVDSDIFLPGKELAELKNKNLHEASGLAASINNPGSLWTLNDSGNPAEVFLINQKLEIKLKCTLKGVDNRDWEDIAVGPGPIQGKNYIYVGEIGDNLQVFPYKNIYRFEEPIVKRDQKSLVIAKFDTITFKLPDGVKDTEALMIHPLTKNLYVISKREDPVYLYELKYPYSTHDTITATKLTALPYTQIVAADFSGNGKEILIKNYKNVYYWKIKGSLEEALKSRPYIVQYRSEPQGEAITFAKDGSGFYTLSEKVPGKDTFLYFYQRK